jgi:uncharacterized protein
MPGLNLIDRFFPPKYDFFGMLSQQAHVNALGVDALFGCLSDHFDEQGQQVIAKALEADRVRMDLEHKLIQAFATPFDRGDLYSISIAMDKVIEYARSTYLSMAAYQVWADEIISGMIAQLRDGVNRFARAVDRLASKPALAEEEIGAIRLTHLAIEQLYRDGLAALLTGGQPLETLRYREVYHHIKDASADLELAVDLLHRIVVRLS